MRDINVADFDAPIGSLTFRDGTTHPIVRADLGAVKLAQRLATDPGNVDLQVQCLARMVPTATEDQLLTLNSAVIDEVVARARDGIAEADALLGESSGASRNGSIDSAPTTATDSSAAELAATTG